MIQCHLEAMRKLAAEDNRELGRLSEGHELEIQRLRDNETT